MVSVLCNIYYIMDKIDNNYVYESFFIIKIVITYQI